MSGNDQVGVSASQAASQSARQPVVEPVAESEKASSVLIGERAVTLTWAEGTAQSLPHLWLRHNCWCESCIEMQTSERKMLLSDVPVDLQPLSACLQGDRLRLRWPDGHESHFDGAAVRALSITPAATTIRWAPGFQPRRIDFQAFLADDRIAAAAIEEFLRSGVAVLIDAPVQEGTLETLAPRLGPVRELLFARIHDVRLDPRGYNVAHTAQALPPHNDFASYSWPPSVQALHMLVNKVAGGKSIVVDGLGVCEDLRAEQPELFEALCTTPVPFREFDDDNETYTVAPIIQRDVDGNLTALRYSNQLMQTVDPMRPGTELFYRAYHALSSRLMAPAARVSFRLEGGQVLLVAAHRVLHAREAFEPTAQRHLQDAYFEHDNVCNHLSVIARRAAEGS